MTERSNSQNSLRFWLPVSVLGVVGALAGLLLGHRSWLPSASALGLDESISDDTAALLILTLAGLLLGAVLSGFLLWRSRKISSSAQAQDISGLPLIAQLPASGSGGERARRQEQEAYRMLRAALESNGIVAVTSAIPGDGKTTATRGIAEAFVKGGRNVIVVEADLRRPRLAKELGVKSGGKGLTAAIVGGVDLDELLVEVSPGLQLLPAGELPPNSSELLSSPDAAEVLKRLGERDAVVILDTPPLLPVADTRELIAHKLISKLVVVARLRHVKRNELARIKALLPEESPALLVVTGDRGTPRSYDRYLRESSS